MIPCRRGALETIRVTGPARSLLLQIEQCVTAVLVVLPAADQQD